MHVHALSALSLVGLATSAAASQLDRRQQASDADSTACLSSIMTLAQASPTVPAALATVTGDCVPTSLSDVAASFTSDMAAWYTGVVDAISDCPAWPTASTIPEMPTLTACTGEQPSRDATTATTTSASGSVATKASTRSASTAASGTESATTTSARSSAASGSAARSATTSSSQSTNAAARETGVMFAAVAMAALGAAAL